TGSDIGEKGEKEFESESNVRSGKGGGAYTAAFEQLEAKYTLTQNFRIAAAAVYAYHNIQDVPEIDDRRRGKYQGLLADARFRLLDRERSPVGLTLSVEPHWNRVDDITGVPVENYGGTVTLAIDKELVSKKLYAAINLLYEPELTHFRETDLWMHQSTMGISGALAVRAASGVFIGAEVRSLHLYDGLGLNSFTGRALFAGPTFYANLSQHWWLSLAWNIQVRGNATDRPGSLDLTNYEHHRATARFGYHF